MSEGKIVKCKCGSLYRYPVCSSCPECGSNTGAFQRPTFAGFGTSQCVHCGYHENEHTIGDRACPTHAEVKARKDARERNEVKPGVLIAAEQRAAGAVLGSMRDAKYICDVPAGAKLIAFGDKILMVAPDRPPHYVTPSGLTLVPRADGMDQ